MEEIKLTVEEKHNLLQEISITDLDLLLEIYDKYDTEDLHKISDEEFIFHEDMDADNAKQNLENYQLNELVVEYIDELKNSDEVYELLLETNVNLEKLGKLICDDYNVSLNIPIKTLLDELKMEQCMKLFNLLSIEQLDELVNKHTKL